MYVESSLNNDKYGFSEKLREYLNTGDVSKFLPDELSLEIEIILNDAYSLNDSEATKVAQNALFMIYQINLTNPLSLPAERQFNPVVCQIRSKIESSWLAFEFKSSPRMTFSEEYETFGDYLKSVWTSHIASHHPLFDFLEKSASKEQLGIFLKSDSALNLIFLIWLHILLLVQNKVLEVPLVKIYGMK